MVGSLQFQRGNGTCLQPRYGKNNRRRSQHQKGNARCCGARHFVRGICAVDEQPYARRPSRSRVTTSRNGWAIPRASQRTTNCHCGRLANFCFAAVVLGVYLHSVVPRNPVSGCGHRPVRVRPHTPLNFLCATTGPLRWTGKVSPAQ